MDKGHSESSRRDPAQLETLFQQGGQVLLASMCESFLERSGQRLAALSASTDPAAMARICHDLKTSCRIVGARHLAQLCETLEYATENGSPPPAGAVQELNEEYLQVRDWLEERLQSPAATAPEEDASDRPEDTNKQPVIALVEDNPDNRLLMSVILGQTYGITEYTSGEEALQGISNSLPDLVLLDVSLPGMDGLDVLKALREDEALVKLPVVALTAHAMHGDRERFLEAGFDEYISKPIVDEQLIFDIIDGLLGRSEQ
jgi:CheY-like chemotaxis protein